MLFLRGTWEYWLIVGCRWSMGEDVLWSLSYIYGEDVILVLTHSLSHELQILTQSRHGGKVRKGCDAQQPQALL